MPKWNPEREPLGVKRVGWGGGLFSGGQIMGPKRTYVILSWSPSVGLFACAFFVTNEKFSDANASF